MKRKWIVHDFGDSLEAASYSRFELKIPSKSKIIKGLGFYSETLQSRNRDVVNVECSLQLNNKTAFAGIVPVTLGSHALSDKDRPNLYPLNYEADENLVTGYINVTSNPLGEPFDLKLYLLIEHQDG